MSYSQSKQVSHMASLYESIYTERLNEEQQNQLLMVEWYNAMIKEGLIKGSLIENGIINENVGAKIAQAMTNLGPALRKITGFGLGPGVGGKRKALTVGAGTVTATDPQKAANQVSGAVTGTATGINRAVRAAAGQAVPAAKKEYQYNSFDSFDAIKGHLLDEGYADTEEAALKIMANMSEEWRESIVEGLVGTIAKVVPAAAKTVGDTANLFRKNPAYAAPLAVGAAGRFITHTSAQSRRDKK